MVCMAILREMSGRLGKRPTPLCLFLTLRQAEVQVCPLLSGWRDRIQQPEKVFPYPSSRFSLVLPPWPHLPLPHIAVNRRGGNLQGTNRLCRGIYDPVLWTSYSDGFSFHFISSANRVFAMARDTNQLSASNRILSFADRSIPAATISFIKWTVLRPSQAMRSSPRRGARCACVWVRMAM